MKIFNFLLFITLLYATNYVAGEITLTAGPVTCEYKKKDLDESYDINSDVNINCNGNTCTVNGNGAIASNALVTISTAGTYILQGSLNGQLRIEATKDDYIHIILNDATITSNNGPAIYGVTADKVTITLVGTNKLVDSSNYTLVDDEPDACLFIDADLSINGSGSVNITGNYSEAIRCKKDLRLISGEIVIPKAVQKGIKAKNSLCVKNANVDITSQNTAIKVTRSDDPDKGYIVIDGGNISIDTNNDGIHAETHLTINGGYIDIKNSSEGIEGQMIDILGGEVHIISTDDGINATKAEDETQSNNNGGWGMGGFGGGATGTDGSIYVNIVGGKTYVTVQGRDVDGIDSNGVLYIGGIAEVYACNNGGAIYGNMAAFDAEGMNAIDSNAVVIATAGGSSSGGRWKRQFPGSQGRPGGQGGQGGPGGGFGMETGKIYQPNIQTSITSQKAGTLLTVKDQSGNVIASFTPINDYSSILVTSPKMVVGQTYTIIAGTSTQTAVAQAGDSGSVTNPPSVTSPPDNTNTNTSTTVTKTTTQTKTPTPTSNNNNNLCSDAILNQGYSCCSSKCTVVYTDEDGTWGYENNQWCGCYIESNSSISNCSASIKNLGYKCCSSNCTVVYTDKDGSWGIENQKWCGCEEKSNNNENSSSTSNCSSSILSKGYSCCSVGNCSVQYVDNDGNWGVENGQW